MVYKLDDQWAVLTRAIQYTEHCIMALYTEQYHSTPYNGIVHCTLNNTIVRRTMS